MKKYVFTKTITVDGVPYQAGDQVTFSQIPAGCFESLTRLRQLVEVDPAAAFVAAMEPKPPTLGPAKPPELLAGPAPAPTTPLVGPPGGEAATDAKLTDVKPVDPKKHPAKK